MTFLEIAKEKFKDGYFDTAIFMLFFSFLFVFSFSASAFFSRHSDCDSYCKQQKVLDLKERELQIKERQIRMENIK